MSRLREELFKMTQFMSRSVPKYLSTEYEHPGDDYLDSAR